MENASYVILGNGARKCECMRSNYTSNCVPKARWKDIW